MARVKHAVSSRRRRKAVLKRAKGGYGGRSKLYRTAKETVMRAMAYSYRDRKVKKRTFRRLWIVRINAACRMQGISYSKFMNGLRKIKAAIDRKILADMAVNDMPSFVKLVEAVKKAPASARPVKK
ncbi:MAG: 50S ribosomal protein L20 [Candidatus Omnitrophica bacterium]|nr:50S ribosomal protein L20 [Candidatus Omnitrophota bacterium]MBU4488072.1 50S ribosomal protein L20 [Candidatus Omnitrophota bacterium]MCG2704862.1 50S ribosomal protein L20 [Candidatus Omnitrophota bacterium]